jgi:DNA-binding MarR family transcriptional regulator
MGDTVHRLDQQGKAPLIGALLRAPFLAARAQIVQDLHGAGFTDLQPAHLAVFQHPGPHGRSPGEIARAALMTKQAMNNLLTQLERAAYLQRVANPNSRRERVVLLTDHGRAAVGVIRRSMDHLEARWRSTLGEHDYASLRATLEKLNLTLSPTGSARDPAAE